MRGQAPAFTIDGKLFLKDRQPHWRYRDYRRIGNQTGKRHGGRPRFRQTSNRRHENTTIVEGGGDKGDSRSSWTIQVDRKIRHRIMTAKSQERLAKLAGGVAVVSRCAHRNRK